jgi:hypothetical protein
MIYNREELLGLRQKAIKYLKDSYTEDIDFLTNILLEYPTIHYCETDKSKIDGKWIKSEYTSTGHGAFGEPEGYRTFRILGWNTDNLSTVFFNSDDEPITCSNLNIDKLVEDVRTAHNESFKL